MTTESTDLVLRMTRRFDAPPERVFDAWVNPETTRRWLFASPADEAFSSEADVRVGGAWTMTARRDGVDYTAHGQYLEIDPPRRLSFTFAMPQSLPAGPMKSSASRTSVVKTALLRPCGTPLLMAIASSSVLYLKQ